MRIIVNADDCGYSEEVNADIEKCIQSHKITSTTILSNMNDFDGAISLYNKYSSYISFGIHLNLTEGTPLTFSQDLLNYGFYKRKESSIVFNGAVFRYKYIPKTISSAIENELESQIKKLLEANVQISHIDSHHHIHTAFSIYPIVVKLAKRYNINKIRTLRNFPRKNLLDSALRNLWKTYAAYNEIRLNYQLLKTNYFSSVEEFYMSKNILNKNCTVELMCHPGGIYKSEEIILQSIDSISGFGGSPINYNQL